VSPHLRPNELPVAVVGAGPIGLAAAAHLAGRNLPFVVFEAGDVVGASVRAWSHVRLFSPWSYNVDPFARRFLEADGWTPPPPAEHPTGGDLFERYLEPLAALPAIRPALRTNYRVVRVTRLGVDKVHSNGRSEAPFVVTAEGPHGIERVLARGVLDASGTWLRPNPIGAGGRPALGEDAVGHAIDYGIPDVLGSARCRYSGGRVAVIGSGHSAQNVARDLAELAAQEAGTTVTWVLRRAVAGSMFGGRDDDLLPARARLGADAKALVASGRIVLETAVRVERVRATDGGLVLVAGDGRELGPFDRLVAATGFRPDLESLSELRLDVDPVLESARALAPLIDPNLHSCASVPAHGAAELAHPEPDLYVVGAKSFGRAPTFLLATGYEQVRSVVAALAGSHAAAVRVAGPLVAQPSTCSPGPTLAVDAGCGASGGGPCDADVEAPRLQVDGVCRCA
jgi:thioredoxin reductase